jgi:threonylcarbamoyladenosine tRNA methylthiotransferase MtaB
MRQNGFKPADSAERASVHIINSCTVTENGDRKVKQLIKRVKKKNPNAVVVLCGCFPKAFPEKAALTGADVIVPGTPSDSVSVQSERTRAFLKIEDGCERECAYCIIPKARGAVKSRPIRDIAAEAETLAANGHKEIVLTGVNLCAYGGGDGRSLSEAVGAVCGVGGIERVRLSSLEPDLISESDIARLAEFPKLCPHFHLSLQSGSDAVLRRMKRRYDADYYEKTAKSLREAFPECALTTDIIAGFPGETEAEFAETLAFAEEMRFVKIHAFAYSRREGTAAADMPRQISNAVKRERVAKLLALSDRLRGDFFKEQTGKERAVLIEKSAKTGETGSGGCFCRSYGRAPDYTPVKIAGEFRRNEIVTVKITGFEGEYCLGETIC